ncbi:protein NETWORKED 2A-like [Mangifera indica]|uniref:protein NETWORKED 2A-like n=1 Tax=Mangifera indica TaxID=29780 RepID=UPI001CFBE01F|nr:protein NETWORKED 2A-like [Mangifera indica]
MLQRAANNAYPWWWASHIRTKQSKWLEQSLQDMEEKVDEMLKIIENDGDSFVQRVNMYYRKRPILINNVEYSYRSYRALAERYDHLSKELQSANRTIATVCPEQVQFEMDDEDEDYRNETSTFDNEMPPKALIPKVPANLNEDFWESPSMELPKKGLKKTGSSAKPPKPPQKSGLTKSEALEETGKLQKRILASQTEEEFVKSSSEYAYEKYWDIENQIAEMQANVSRLQDEFGIHNVIDDNEARTLTTALKSCQETLAKLQGKQEQSAGMAKVEFQRILEYHEKFADLRNEFLPKQTNEHEPFTFKKHLSTIAESDSELKELDPEISRTQSRGNVKLFQENFKKQFAVDSDSSSSVTQMVEKIDGLIDEVVNLEHQVSSQMALVMSLRSENDQIQALIHSLEGDKETMIAGSDNMNKRLMAVEEELARIRSLNESVEDQNNNLQTHFTEASCSIDYLSKKLQSMDLEENVEDEGLFPQVKAASDAKAENQVKKEEKLVAESGDSAVGIKEPKPEKDNNSSFLSISAKPEEQNIVDSRPNVKLDVNSENCQELRLTNEEKDQKTEMSNRTSCNLNADLEEPGIEEGEPNWRMLSPGLEERDKSQSDRTSCNLYADLEEPGIEEGEPNWRMLSPGLEEAEKSMIGAYTSVLQKYKDVKRKLSEVEKNNRDGLIELALQIRELEIAVAYRDDEIQSLRNKISSRSPQTSMTESHQGGSASRESIMQSGISPESFFSSQASPQPVPFSEHSYDFEEKTQLNKSPLKEETNLNLKYAKTPISLTTTEEKIRSDINKLLEDNLEFWLRFSTSYQQIKKYQSTVYDLKAELTKLKSKGKKEGNKKHPYLPSDPQLIYEHLKEVQTELKLWLENNEVLKDELNGRYSSLCSIQEEIERVSNTGGQAEENGQSSYRAAKFQGEVLNMKQENTKISEQLLAGHERVEKLKMEVETTLAEVDDEFRRQGPIMSRARIPLKSFLFGVKLKKHKQKSSLFSFMNPTLQKPHRHSSPAVAGRHR